MSHVIKSGIESFRQFSGSMIDGSFRLVEFDKLRDQLDAEKKGEINLEIKQLLEFGTTDVVLIEKRIKQLEIYQKLHNIKQISDLMLQLKKINELEGDFVSLELLNSSV